MHYLHGNPHSNLIARSRSRRAWLALAPLFAIAGSAAHPAIAQSFGLDDSGQAPLTAPAGFGAGAEDPYGFAFPMSLAPSPSLGILPALDGDILAPGPFVLMPSPNGAYIDSLSRNHDDMGLDIDIEFSVDRATRGVAGTAVASEAGFGQAHGDIYTSTQTYRAPGAFVGTLGAGPFAGYLASVTGGAPGNTLTIDESGFGLRTPSGVVGPGVAVPSPFATPGQHDNLDSYDNLPGGFDTDGDLLFDVDGYYTIYPDEAFPASLSPSSIFAVAAGDASALPVSYAPSASMGLLPLDDSIDALVMYDVNQKPIPMTNAGAPGAVEPGVDYALFSLAPGSFSLGTYGLDPSDVLFTDFTGAFAVYARSASNGLLTTPNPGPFQGENIDALDVIEQQPDPNTITIQDAGCVYSLRRLTGHRLTAGAGTATWFTGANNHMAQNWFWYRAPGDSREYALSSQVHNSSAANHARLVYIEPIADGMIPDALSFDLEYTLSDLSTSRDGANPPACVRCELVIGIKVRNLTAGPVDLDFFTYNDMDLNGTFNADTAVISGVDNQIQLISDPGPVGTNCVTSAVFKCSSSDHAGWEIAAFPALRSKLSNAGPDVLANAASPLGPGDYTGAHQWRIHLGPAGSVGAPPFDEWVGTVVKEIIIHNPGDVNGDCAVNISDLGTVLSSFGISCTP